MSGRWLLFAVLTTIKTHVRTDWVCFDRLGSISSSRLILFTFRFKGTPSGLDFECISVHFYCICLVCIAG